MSKKQKENYIRKGKCKRCGKCCQWRYLIKDVPLKIKIILVLLNPIFLIKSKCPHLGFDKNGKAYCKIYDHRPWFCRAFPAEPADLVDKDCGYYFEKEK